jgi:uncharacterized protein (DUF302 family)
MSHDDDKLIHSRREIKSKLSKKLFGSNLLKKMAIIPVRNQSTSFPNLAFSEFCNTNFLDKAINDVLETNEFTFIVVDTDDKNVYDYLSNHKNVFVNLREQSLIGDNIPLSLVIYNLINNLELHQDIYCDLFAIIQINCPLREKDHIVEGLNTILMFDVDHVISTYEDLETPMKGYDQFFVYGLCHFTFSYNIFNKGRPDAGVFAPCAMYFYIKEGSNKMVVGMPRLSVWSAVMELKDPEHIKWVKKVDDEIVSLMKKLGGKEI